SGRWSSLGRCLQGAGPAARTLFALGSSPRASKHVGGLRALGRCSGHRASPTSLPLRRLPGRRGVELPSWPVSWQRSASGSGSVRSPSHTGSGTRRWAASAPGRRLLPVAPELPKPDIRPQLRELLAWYDDVLQRIAAGAMVERGGAERLSEEREFTARHLELLDADEESSPATE